MPRPGSLLVSCLLLLVVLILVLGRWGYAIKAQTDTTATTVTTDTTTASMVTVTVTTTQLSCVLSLGVCPFVRFVGVAPNPPEVFDVVGVTVRVQGNDAVPVLWLDWAFLKVSMIEEWGGRAFMNATGVFDYTIYHAFTYPGDYYLRVGVVDAQNRTAQDVHSLYVERQSTQLELLVMPQNLNTTELDHYTLVASLSAVTGAAIPESPILFSYSSDAENWLPIETVRTSGNGQAIITFKPPFEGLYQFQALFVGDELHQESEAYSFDSVVTPEFPIPALIGGLSVVFVALLPRRVRV